MSQKKKYIIAGILIALGGVAYYGIAPIFNTSTANDPLPQNNNTAQNTATTTNEEDLAPTTPMDEPMPDTTAGPTILAQGTVNETSGHPASGEAKIVETSDGHILRYENFETLNGPRLHVYLATDRDASDFIDLGPIKATNGNINYEIPEGTDLSKYKYALTWCVPFGVLFNYAQLQ